LQVDRVDKGNDMSVSYYLACFETRKYVWVGNLAPQETTLSTNAESAIATFALEHRNKPLTVVSDSHPILEEGIEWSPPTTQKT
jgi:hypothetical protein